MFTYGMFLRMKDQCIFAQNKRVSKPVSSTTGGRLVTYLKFSNAIILIYARIPISFESTSMQCSFRKKN